MARKRQGQLHMFNKVENNNLVGTYDNEDVFVDAIRSIKQNGIAIKNVFTPYPIHEVFHELEISTRFSYLAFIYGVSGTVGTFGFLYWTSVINFPIRIGGKPHLSLSFIVIMFVMTILVGIILSVVSFFVRQQLFPGKEPVLAHSGNTDDKFSLVIEVKDSASIDEVNEITSKLRKSGAIEVVAKKNIGKN